MSYLLVSGVLMVLAVYGSYLDLLNNFFYKSRKVKSKSGEVLRAMRIYLIAFQKNKFTRSITIDMHGLRIDCSFVILCKHRFYIMDPNIDSIICSYTELPYELRKALYFTFLKKRYPVVFSKLSISKEKVLEEINVVAQRKPNIHSIKLELCNMLDHMSVTDIYEEEL